ncbi:hypothetical protein [Bradyrhizobium valentinum]|nr:hypothetical protein [Bradyrhizobium valentinum]
MTAWVYVDKSKEAETAITSRSSPARNPQKHGSSPEGVAFEYEVIGPE